MKFLFKCHGPVGTAGCRLRSVEIELLAEVNTPDLRVGRETFRHSLPEDLTFFDDIGPVCDLQSLAHVVVGDEDPNPTGPQLRNDALNFEHCDWIDSCKGLI